MPKLIDWNNPDVSRAQAIKYLLIEAVGVVVRHVLWLVELLVFNVQYYAVELYAWNRRNQGLAHPMDAYSYQPTPKGTRLLESMQGGRQQ